jgi:hypothetical protein
MILGNIKLPVKNQKNKKIVKCGNSLPAYCCAEWDVLETGRPVRCCFFPERQWIYDAADEANFWHRSTVFPALQEHFLLTVFCSALFGG